MHLQPALAYLGYSEGEFPETEKAARENLSLPLWAGITRTSRPGRGRRPAHPGSSPLKLFPVNRHRVWQLVFDAVLIAAAWRLTFFLRFDKSTPPYYRHLLDSR